MNRDDILFWAPWGAGFLFGVLLGYSLAVSSDPWLTLLASSGGFAFGWFAFGWFGTRWVCRRLTKGREER